jgi:hypothetical protein
MRVLIAIEPRSYREVIRGLRPHLEVAIVEPDALEPELVICSRPSVAATNGRAAWIAFRPYDQPAAKIYVGDRYPASRSCA